MSEPGTCKDCLHVESGAAPFTKERRRLLLERVRRGQSVYGGASYLVEGYEATLRQAEAALAEMQEERDAYKAFFSWWLGKDTVESALVDHVYALAMSDAPPEDERVWRAALEGIRDLPQPSGNSGGFAAAAGILKDTWDGEPSENAIRRLRDGTPPPEGKP